jgi:hypothetical protein
VTGVTGSLDLPSGFQAIVSPDNSGNNNGNSNSNTNTALASYNTLIKAGQSFVLYFPINVLSSAQVDKQYTASLKLHVLKFEREQKSNSKLQRSHKVVPINEVQEGDNIQSVINGSKTLNKSKSQSTNKLTPFDFTSRRGRNQVATSNNNIITPVTSGNVSISSNLVQQNNIIPLVISGSTTFNVGSIQTGQTKKIETAVLPSNAVGGTLETLTVRIAYDDAYGNKKMTDIVGVQILPSNPRSALNVSPLSHP